MMMVVSPRATTFPILHIIMMSVRVMLMFICVTLCLQLVTKLLAGVVMELVRHLLGELLRLQ
jgi:DMSO/TMAO reductase YedYZ heme-binding membrane subunit